MNVDRKTYLEEEKDNSAETKYKYYQINYKMGQVLRYDILILFVTFANELSNSELQFGIS